MTAPSSVSTFLQSAETLAERLLKASLAPADRYTGHSLADRNAKVIRELLPFYSWFYHYYFRVKTDGWEHIPPTGKVLLVGAHNGGLAAPDTVMMAYDWMKRFGPDRPAYALMDLKIWQAFPGLARLATQVGAIQANASMAVTALRHGAAVLLYPGGVQDVFRPYSLRRQIYFQGNTSFIKLALMESAPIVPLISRGAHSTLVILADVYEQLQGIQPGGFPWPFDFDPGTFPIYIGLPWGLAIGPWPNIPMPVTLHTRVCPPVVFERYGAAAAHDQDYVDACYQQVCDLMQTQLDSLFAERACFFNG